MGGRIWKERNTRIFLRKERLMPLLFAAIKQKAKLGGLAALRIFFGLYRPCNSFVFSFAVSPCRWLLSPPVILSSLLIEMEYSLMPLAKKRIYTRRKIATNTYKSACYLYLLLLSLFSSSLFSSSTGMASMLPRGWTCWTSCSAIWRSRRLSKPWRSLALNVCDTDSCAWHWNSVLSCRHTATASVVLPRPRIRRFAFGRNLENIPQFVQEIT